MKYSLDDIFIVPAVISDIDSRSECETTYDDGKLPLFTAPMSSVVDTNNYKLFESCGINAIIPRTVDLNTRINMMNGRKWCAFSISEFEDIYNNKLDDAFSKENPIKILIDIANGNMKMLHDLVREVKSEYGDNIKIMTGNVANPLTYETLSNAGADYIRIGVGTGSACLTASNTSVYYPMGSLIKEVYEISTRIENPAYIVADGGMKNYSDIIKSLALGADFVMCGGIFNKMLESAAKTIHLDITGKGMQVDQYSKELKSLFKNSMMRIVKEHYGMSTKRAQIEMGRKYTTTSEGVEKTNDVEYTMEQWVENFNDYLKSAMSYTSSKTLHDFIGEVETVLVSNNSKLAINK